MSRSCSHGDLFPHFHVILLIRFAIGIIVVVAENVVWTLES